MLPGTLITFVVPQLPEYSKGVTFECSTPIFTSDRIVLAADGEIDECTVYGCQYQGPRKNLMAVPSPIHAAILKDPGVDETGSLVLFGGDAGVFIVEKNGKKKSLPFFQVKPESVLTKGIFHFLLAEDEGYWNIFLRSESGEVVATFAAVSFEKSMEETSRFLTASKSQINNARIVSLKDRKDMTMMIRENGQATFWNENLLPAKLEIVIGPVES